MRSISTRLAGTLLILGVAGCWQAREGEGAGGQEPAAQPGIAWAIAIHGGAGSAPDTMPDDERRAYLDSLSRALEIGRSVLDGGGDSLDAVERTIRSMEDDPRFNAGRGAVFTRDGRNELDASIMDGSTLACGAVTGVTTVKNPISLARRVMEQTAHVLLAGEGAERFADDAGVERVEPDYFFTQQRWDSLQRALSKDRNPAAAGPQGTVGVVALDRHGNLAAGTSTGGLTGKMAGRVGDTPVVGAGTYARNDTCAVSATGRGEEFIRRSVAHSISALVEFGGLSLDEAVAWVVDDQLRPGDGGVIAVDARGRVAMAFNTQGMYRGAADSTGRFEVAIRD